jgi:hypothetical protein
VGAVRLKSPALGQWRSEIQQGCRRNNAFDWLWRAACEEAAAEEAERVGLLQVAQIRREIAAAIVVVGLRKSQ